MDPLVLPIAGIVLVVAQIIYGKASQHSDLGPFLLVNERPCPELCADLAQANRAGSKILIAMHKAPGHISHPASEAKTDCDRIKWQKELQSQNEKTYTLISSIFHATSEYLRPIGKREKS